MPGSTRNPSPFLPRFLLPGADLIHINLPPSSRTGCRSSPRWASCNIFRCSPRRASARLARAPIIPVVQRDAAGPPVLWAQQQIRIVRQALPFKAPKPTGATGTVTAMANVAHTFLCVATVAIAFGGGTCAWDAGFTCPPPATPPPTPPPTAPPAACVAWTLTQIHYSMTIDDDDDDDPVDGFSDAYSGYVCGK